MEKYIEKYFDFLDSYVYSISEKDLLSKESLLVFFNLVAEHTNEITFFIKIRDFIIKENNLNNIEVNLKQNLPNVLTALNTNIKNLSGFDFFDEDKVNNLLDKFDQYKSSSNLVKAKEYILLSLAILKILSLYDKRKLH